MKPPGSKKKLVTFKHKDATYEINANGGIRRDEWDGVQVTARELDQIVAHATFLRSVKHPDAPGVLASEHEVEFSEDFPGDISIGCVNVDHKKLLQVHRLSLAVRKRGKKK